MNEPDVSIVIACYNEAGHLKQSVSEVRAVMDQTRYRYELIFVDDCSQDGTRDIIRDIASSDPARVKVRFHETNLGRGATVSDGIRLSEAQYVGFLDIDLEVHARYIPTMILALQNGYDVATAYRIYRVTPRKLVRHVTSYGYRYLSRAVLGHRLLDTETGYKFFNRARILPTLAETRDRGWFWDTEIMVYAWRNGLKIQEIPCLFAHRFDKKSTISLHKDIRDYLVNLYRFNKRLRHGSI